VMLDRGCRRFAQLAGTLASAFDARATTGTIRAQLINVRDDSHVSPAESGCTHQPPGPGTGVATASQRHRARITADRLTDRPPSTDPTGTPTESGYPVPGLARPAVNARA
jgi:hypothetical protein